MDDPREHYGRLRLEKCRQALEKNHFEAYIAETPAAAKEIILGQILPKIGARTASWGDSMTLQAVGILDELRSNPEIDFLETFDQSVSRAEVIERRRKAFLVDLFLTGTNAVTETGMLVNLDQVGNRVAALTFGPRHVVITVGRNKIVADLDEAMKRIKDYAAPVNAMRHPDLKTPCVKTSYCMDCKSPDRICNTWVITEKSYPPGRIKVILINREMGL
ncbi:MAG: lactate utilization protein [Desulfobacteraceae bacterium]|nr:MAG: lactate utilization protein [Desulfobacteraceae bacterium]